MTCEVCSGTGWVQYDSNHSKVCAHCCKHSKGWWLLEEHYGDNNGKWACRAGCGTIATKEPVLVQVEAV